MSRTGRKRVVSCVTLAKASLALPGEAVAKIT